MSQQHFSYSSVPSAKQFQKDSSITFAVRADDQILTYLDWLLERYEHYNAKNDYGLRRIVLCEIFLSANYWVKSYHEGRPRMHVFMSWARSTVSNVERTLSHSENYFDRILTGVLVLLAIAVAFLFLAT